MFFQIVDPSTGKEMPPGMSGEICIRGPTVMLGYLGKPDATKSTIIDGWLHTGTVFPYFFAVAELHKQLAFPCSSLPVTSYPPPFIRKGLRGVLSPALLKGLGLVNDLTGSL